MKLISNCTVFVSANVSAVGLRWEGMLKITFRYPDVRDRLISLSSSFVTLLSNPSSLLQFTWSLDFALSLMYHATFFKLQYMLKKKGKEESRRCCLVLCSQADG